MVIGQILERNLWRYPHKEAMCFENTRLSFLSSADRIYRLANALCNLGLKKGDPVAFLLPHNMIEAQEIIFALGVTGMPIVPINARFSSTEIAHLVSRCKVKGLIYHHSLSDLLESVRPSLKNVQIFVAIGQPTSLEDYDYEKLLLQNPPTPPDVSVKESDIAALIHTSGTTGMPKEVIWTHRSWLAGVRDIIITFQLTDRDILLMFTPYFHIPFFWFNLAVSYMGGCLVFIRRPDPHLILEAIEKHKVTVVSHFVPTTLIRVLDFPDLDRYDVSSVRYYMYGGAPMPFGILERAVPKMGNRFIQLYGFTELAGCAAALTPEEHNIDGTEKERRRLLSCGREMPSSDIRIVDERGRVVGPGVEGELIYRGDNLMKGYWRNPAETKAVLKDGWFHTGDVGFMDEDRYIYISGRKKDIIISGGENITPKQVEDVICKHPSVEMAAVIGIPDPKWGEAVKAVVVLKKGKQATEEEIIQLCKDNLASYKVPKSVDFVPSLPTTHTGKIKKWELRERYTKKAGHKPL